MKDELDSILELMEDLQTIKGEKLAYHGDDFEVIYYHGKIADKEIVACQCGVGQVYAALNTTTLITAFRPELIINLGVAGTLNKDVKICDVVVADRIAQWRMDIPDWERSFASEKFSFKAEPKILKIAENLSTPLNVHIGSIVSADEFIYRQDQIEVIHKYFPEALCGEMEGSAVAAVAYAYSVPFTIIRSISDDTLVEDNYSLADFNLSISCKQAAAICYEIIRRF